MNLKGKKNTTFTEIPFQLKVNNIELDITGYIIAMQLKRSYEGAPIYDIDIDIYDPTNGRFKIVEFIPTIAGNFLYDIKIKDTNDVVVRWIEGEFLIENSVTNGN